MRAVDDGYIEFANELIEEQTAKALRRTGIPSEKRTLDHLGEIHEREHGLIEIGEVPTQDVGLFTAESFGSCKQHRNPT